MRALERLRGLRVVADPAALDAARWSGGAGRAGRDGGSPATDPTVLRIAPDEALAVDAVAVDLADPSAIVERETGFVGRWLTEAELEAFVAPHVEWELPTARPAFVQGSIAGVPAKLLLIDAAAGAAGDVAPPAPADSGEGIEARAALLVTAAAYAAELEARLR